MCKSRYKYFSEKWHGTSIYKAIFLLIWQNIITSKQGKFENHLFSYKETGVLLHLFFFKVYN